VTTPVRDHLTQSAPDHDFPAYPVHSLAGYDLNTEREAFYIRTPRVARLLSFLADVLCVGGSALVTLYWFSLSPRGFHHIPLRECLAQLMLYSALVVLACRGLHLYIRPRRAGTFVDVATVTYAVLLATGVVLLYLYLADGVVPAAVPLCAGTLDLATLIGWRAIRAKATERRVARGRGMRNVLIIGAGRVGRSLAHHLEHNRELGYNVMGFLDETASLDTRVLGTVDDLRKLARTKFVDEILITIPSNRDMVRRVVTEAEEYNVRVRVVPELFDGLGLQAPIDYVGRFPVLELYRQPIPEAGLLAKRAIDIVAAAAGIILAAPVLLLLSLLIKLDSRGPVLYRSRRVGKKGRQFVCYKFRSMVTDADLKKAELRKKNYRQGPTFKIADDPRITRIGRLLRKFSIDELPQLWNILRGDMSLVGPRPHPLDDFELYDAEHMVRLHVKPGLTGLWQVMARRDPSFEKNMELDLEYIENWTLMLDFKIMLRTIPAVMQGHGQ
jgi:exopolysaccharide biosynthesis polyprenyl glycosylphosphotransferase